MSGQDSGTIIEILRIIDNATNLEVAEVNRFIKTDGTIGASGELDPAYIVVRGVAFRRFRGPDKFRREPELLLPAFRNGILRRAYGWFRKRCCLLLGPEKDGALAAKMFPILAFICFWNRRPSA